MKKMEEYKDIIEKLNKESEKLEPTNLEKSRVENIVFAKDYAEAEQNDDFAKKEKLNFFSRIMSQDNKVTHKAASTSWNIFKSKAFLALASFIGISVFVGVPTIYMGISSPDVVYVDIDRDEEYTRDKKEERNLAEEDGLNIQGGSPIEFFDNEERGQIIGFDQGIASGFITIPESSNPFRNSEIAEDTSTTASNRVQKRDATMSIEVENFDEKYGQLSDKVAAIGGYVVNSNRNTYDDYTYANFTLRIPVDKFDEFITFTRGLSVKVTSENISLTDRQNELTQIVKQIESNQSRIDELNSKENLTDGEKSELYNLENTVKGDKARSEDIKMETEFSTVNIYMATEGYWSDSSEDWNIGNTFENVLDAVQAVIQFWVNAGLWIIVPIVFLLPVVGVIYVIVKVVRGRGKNI